MADIAEIGFKAQTSELSEAKLKLEQLVPAAGRAEKASKMLEKAMESGSRAAVLAASADVRKATAVLSAAKASDTATKADIAAAGASVRKAKAARDAASAALATATASKAAAAAAKQEATAFDQAAAAKKKYQSVPNVDGRRKPGPWGDARPSPVNDNVVGQSAGAMKANVGNIAAQFQDIGVTAAMGMNPLLIALQQGTQLSAVFAQTGGNAFKTIAMAIGQVLSPTALLTIGFVALGAALLQLVNWTSLAQWGLNALADILPEVAIGLTLVGVALTVAFAPAILSTFLSVFLAVAAGIVGAVATIIATIGAIPIAIGLILADLYVFRDEWAQVLGFDIVGAAKIGINFIIGAFVAAYNDIQFLWAQLPNIIGAAAVGAANAVIRALNAMISASISGINMLAQQVNKIGSALDSVGLGFSIGAIDAGGFKFDEMANTAADTLATAVGDRNKQLQDTLQKDYLGAIGGAITGAAESAAGKLREFSAGMGDDAKKKKAGGGGKTEGEKFEDIVKGAERTIASLEAEKAALGQTAVETARLKYETDLLNQAQQKNITLTPAQREQLGALASEMANLEASTERAKNAMDFGKELSKGFMNDFIQGIKNGESVWQSFGKAAMSVLDKIGQKLVDLAIDGLFSGGGGGLGGLLGGIGKLFGFAKGGSFANGINGHSNQIVDRPTMFAFAKGAGIMGEAGPEAIMPLKKGPDGSLGVQMHGERQGGGTMVVSPVTENTYILSGAISEESVVKSIRAAAENSKEETKRELVGWINQYQRDGAFS